MKEQEYGRQQEAQTQTLIKKDGVIPPVGKLGHQNIGETEHPGIQPYSFADEEEAPKSPYLGEIVGYYVGYALADVAITLYQKAQERKNTLAQSRKVEPFQRLSSNVARQANLR